MKIRLLAGLTTGLFLLAALSVLGSASAAGPGNVYTIDNAATNHLLWYQSGPNGALSLAGTISAMGGGTGVALHSQGAVELTKDGQWLLVVDAGSNQITVFQLRGDGTPTVTDVVSSQGLTPISLTISNNLVYVLNSGTPNIAGFTLSNSGQLSFIPGTIEPLSGIASSSPEQIGFVNTGPPGPGQGPAPPGPPTTGVLIVTEKGANAIDTYTVGNNGIESAPTVIPSDGAGPYGFAFTNQGFLVVSEAASDSVSSYVVSNDGALRTISGAVPDTTFTSPTPCWIAISQNGQFAYSGNGGSGTLSVYSISGQGTLSLVSAIAVPKAGATLDLVFSGGGQYLYNLNGAGYITTFQTYPDGGISQTSTVSVPTTSAGLAAT